MPLLTVDFSETLDGTCTLEALASTRPAQHGQALAEAQCLLDWAWQLFPDSHGPLDEGHDWHHDLQVSQEPDGWQQVALTLTGRAAFMEALRSAFPELLD